MRLLTLGLILALILAACDFDADSTENDPPTPVVITSTPTSSDSAEGQATATEAPAGSATATEEDVPTPSPTETTDSAEATPTEQADSPGDEEQSGTVAEIEEIEADVVELRELELVEDLNEEVIDRAELESRVESLVDYSPEEASEDALAYWLLRLIEDRNIDLYQLQLDLLGEQIAGYYNPETDDLVVVTQTGELAAIDKVTMAHEIVHALQDQHFDLVEIDSLASDTDRDLAISALVEGDATFTMGAYLLEYLDPFELMEIFGESFAGSQDFEVLDNAPRYIAGQLVFAYEDGQAFVDAVYSVGGYEAVNAAFQNPPLSTEQILHPEKYRGGERDDPVEVENPDLQAALGADWELLTGDVLGEWDLRIMLEENGLSPNQAANAAAGWGGSRYDLYQSGDNGLALLTTRWDSEADATEFSEALSQTFDGTQEDGGFRTDGERFFWTQTSGDTVVLITGTDRGAVEAAAGAIG